jgi:hypothetical protein
MEKERKKEGKKKDKQKKEIIPYSISTDLLTV